MHEGAIVAFLRDFAARERLAVRTDRFGNVMIRSGKGRPRYVVMAHMDHPGCEVIRSRGREAVVRILGGLDPRQVARARLRFFCSGQAIRARGTGGIVLHRERGVMRPHAEFRIRAAVPIPRGTFGMLDLPPVRFVNGLVKARAIDNIANCALILDCLAEAHRRRIPLCGVFTRAEEIGCVGAQALIRTRGLPRNVPILVLEASSAKVAKVTIGAGPVIRVGDRIASFDPRVDLWLHHTAARLQKAGAFQFQRALMAGGATEGAYYIMDGLMVGALALPLGNYHNRGRSGPAPEVIAWRDWLGLRQLLGALLSAPSPQKVAQQVRARLWRT